MNAFHITSVAFLALAAIGAEIISGVKYYKSRARLAYAVILPAIIIAAVSFIVGIVVDAPKWLVHTP